MVEKTDRSVYSNLLASLFKNASQSLRSGTGNSGASGPHRVTKSLLILSFYPRLAGGFGSDHEIFLYKDHKLLEHLFETSPQNLLPHKQLSDFHTFFVDIWQIYVTVQLCRTVTHQAMQNRFAMA